MRPHRIVVPAPLLDQHLRLGQAVEHLRVEQLVPELAVEAFHIAVFPRAELAKVPAAQRLECQRRVPGSMYAVLARTPVIQPFTAVAVNSHPLSERMNPGVPRAMNRSASTSMTSAEPSLRPTRMHRHSRVNSSTTLSMRSLRPSRVLSSTKSYPSAAFPRAAHPEPRMGFCSSSSHCVIS